MNSPESEPKVSTPNTILRTSAALSLVGVVSFGISQGLEQLDQGALNDAIADRDAAQCEYDLASQPRDELTEACLAHISGAGISAEELRASAPDDVEAAEQQLATAQSRLEGRIEDAQSIEDELVLFLGRGVVGAFILLAGTVTATIGKALRKK